MWTSTSTAQLIGRISKAKPLVVPSLSSGMHEFQGVKAGYEPERKQIMIAPGQESAVTLRIRYVRQVKPPALALNEQGEKLLFTRRSSLSLMNLVPTERKQSDGDLQRAADAVREGARRSIRTTPSPPITSARSISCCSITKRASSTSSAPSRSIRRTSIRESNAPRC